jgi:hypothetical protein
MKKQKDSSKQLTVGNFRSSEMLISSKRSMKIRTCFQKKKEQSYARLQRVKKNEDTKLVVAVA